MDILEELKQKILIHNSTAPSWAKRAAAEIENLREALRLALTEGLHCECPKCKEVFIAVDLAIPQEKNDVARCHLCGEPMPPGEEMFNYHGYSGPCPKPPEG